MIRVYRIKSSQFNYLNQKKIYIIFLKSFKKVQSIAFSIQTVEYSRIFFNVIDNFYIALGALQINKWKRFLECPLNSFD